MKKMLYVIIAILAALLILLMGLSLISRKMPESGIVNGSLSPCPDTPNCVSSEYEGKSFVNPLLFSGPPQAAWERAKGVIKEMGGSIVVEKEAYLRAVFTTNIFRFQDDVELRMDRENGRIHMRSSSRVGYSDFGKNRKRAERIRVRFQEKQR